MQINILPNQNAPIKYLKGIVSQQDTGFHSYAPEEVIIKQPTKKPRGTELDKRGKIRKLRIKRSANGD
jgi:hypothetical protein